MADLFTPVSSGRISAQLVDQIQTAIREGQLTPGDRLPSERELSNRFGVSRVTVRDALRSLEVLGLVEIKVGASGGAFVQSPGTDIVGAGLTNLMLLSPLEPDDIAETRLVIELGTVALATVRGSEEDLEQLEKLVVEAEQALEVDSYETSQSVRFHMNIAEAAGNDAMSLLAESFRGALSMRRVREHEPATEAHAVTVTEHRAIIDAMRERDVPAARRAMSAHLLRGLSDPDPVLAALLGSDEATS